MKKSFLYPYIKTGMSYLFFFFLIRTFFIVSFKEHATDTAFQEILAAFFYGLRMDVSVICYIFIFPMLMDFVSFFRSDNTFKKRLTRYYHGFVFLFVTVLAVLDLGFYEYWGTKLNQRLFMYLQNPSEAIASVEAVPVLPYVIVFVLLVGIGVFLLKGIETKSHPIEARLPLIVRVVIIFLTLGVLLVGLRGGLQLIPINQSASYYSKNPMLNNAALNTGWNFIHSVLKSSNGTEVEWFESNMAESIVNRHFIPDSTAINLLSNTRPNIVLVVLETWTADIIESLEGEKNVTPFYDELREKGFSFNQMYGSGYRTDIGIVSILSGYPSLPGHSIIKSPSKISKFPSLNSELNKMGYQSLFLYGGELGFANLNAYLLNQKYDYILGKSAFSSEDQTSKWGVHDHLMFARAETELDKLKSPFFATLLTLSSHEPFDVPFKSEFTGGSQRDKFLNAAKYTDSSLRTFFETVKEKPWFRNTIFVLIADHGTGYVRKHKHYAPEKFRIPFLIVGEPLSEDFRGKSSERIASQMDLVSTLFSQLSEKPSPFKWSRNLLSLKPDSGFAYYSFPAGIGLVHSQGKFVYGINSEKEIYQSGKVSKEKKDFLKAYYQQVNNEFIKL